MQQKASHFSICNARNTQSLSLHWQESFTLDSLRYETLCMLVSVLIKLEIYQIRRDRFLFSANSLSLLYEVAEG